MWRRTCPGTAPRPETAGGVRPGDSRDTRRQPLMHTRTYAATTALLLTASAAGVALAGGSAQAVGSHHTTTKAATSLTVTIKTKAGQIQLSDTRIRPGKTIFKVRPHGKGGDMQVLRLRSGYTLT